MFEPNDSTEQRDHEVDDWAAFTRTHPNFTTLYLKALKLIPTLFQTNSEGDEAGMVVLQLALACYSDFDDIMTLSCKDAHWGAFKLLRVLFERVVTLKYIAQNPTEVTAFLEFDAVDWKMIVTNIENKLRVRLSETSGKNLDEAAAKARKKFKQEPCKVCGLRKQTTWTPFSVQELAKRTSLSYLFFEAFALPNKYIHPTYFGTRDVLTMSPPMYNTLKDTHALLVETVLTCSRYFHPKEQLSEMITATVKDFFEIWKIADTDCGLADVCSWHPLT